MDFTTYRPAESYFLNTKNIVDPKTKSISLTQEVPNIDTKP